MLIRGVDLLLLFGSGLAAEGVVDGSEVGQELLEAIVEVGVLGDVAVGVSLEGGAALAEFGEVETLYGGAEGSAT